MLLFAHRSVIPTAQGAGRGCCTALVLGVVLSLAACAAAPGLPTATAAVTATPMPMPMPMETPTGPRAAALLPPDTAAQTASLQADVQRALNAYREGILRSDADGLAALFTANAEVSHGDAPPVLGREAIRLFLKSFSAFRVQEYVLRADTTDVRLATSRTNTNTNTDTNTKINTNININININMSATQNGVYQQTVIAPKGAVLKVQGKFVANWVRVSNGTGDASWQLTRMHTESL